MRTLAVAGVPTIHLEDYTGAPTDAVKVGTIKHARGLELKQVLIPDVSRKQTSGEVPTDDTERERWDLDRREL